MLTKGETRTPSPIPGPLTDVFSVPLSRPSSNAMREAERSSRK
jgi:hypothetical protein